MNNALIIRIAARSDLPQLLALYPHLDPADRIPPLDVAERRFDELQSHRGSVIFIGYADDDLVTSCTLNRDSQPDARRTALCADRERGDARCVQRTGFRQTDFASGRRRGVASRLLQGYAHDRLEAAVHAGVLRFRRFRAEQDRFSGPAPSTARGAGLTVLATGSLRSAPFG